MNGGGTLWPMGVGQKDNRSKHIAKSSGREEDLNPRARSQDWRTETLMIMSPT